jgi:geranylgeranyl diphosphate synthase type II
LAGDALLTLAFQWMAEAGQRAHASARYLRAVAALARGAGPAGMVRGQARDMAPTPPATLEEIERLHEEKTGALFRAAMEIGAAVAGATPTQTKALSTFGTCFGIAFQHADDRDDDDHAAFAEVASRRVHELVIEATTAIEGFNEKATPLRALARRLDASAPNPE